MARSTTKTATSRGTQDLCPKGIDIYLITLAAKSLIHALDIIRPRARLSSAARPRSTRPMAVGMGQKLFQPRISRSDHAGLLHFQLSR